MPVYMATKAAVVAHTSLKASLTLKVKVRIFKKILVQNLQMINIQLKFEGKIPTVQKLLHSQGITQNVQASRPI